MLIVNTDRVAIILLMANKPIRRRRFKLQLTIMERSDCLNVVKTNELKPGEYRSHLYFRAVPDDRPLGDKPSKKDSANISIQLTPIFGITIPAIIRMGDYDGNATLTDFAFTNVNNTPSLGFTFRRTGTMSIYGDIKVDYVAPDGKITPVKVVKGVGVYTPNKVRNFKTDLDVDNANPIDFHHGKLHVTYTLQMNDKSVKAIEEDVALK